MQTKIENVPVLLQIDGKLIVIFFDQHLKEGHSYDFLSIII